MCGDLMGLRVVAEDLTSCCRSVQFSLVQFSLNCLWTAEWQTSVYMILNPDVAQMQRIAYQLHIYIYKYINTYINTYILSYTRTLIIMSME
jgi:hypothetical protein